MKPNFALLAAAATAMALFACTTNSTSTDSSATTPSGPPIDADQVGTACSGVGTSPGDTAVFSHDDCPAGLCVADARTDFDTYCTADCEGRACPDGFTCEEVTFGDSKHVCLKDGSTSDTPPSATPPSTTPGPIGTKITKGTDSIDVNFSSHGSYSCGSECTKAGGKCNESGATNGVGWVDRKYNDSSGDTTGNQISSCTEYEDYISFNTTMTGMQCFCDDMTVPTTVKVTKSQGLTTCDAVCKSWSMTCSDSRKNYAYADSTDGLSTKITCATAPSSSTDHYVCSCD